MRNSWVKNAKRPLEPSPRASEFANWVFEQSVGRWRGVEAKSNLQLKRLGKVDHRSIELFLQTTWVQDLFGNSAKSEWTKFFADDGSQPAKIFQSSRLLIGLSPMRCIPDVVLQHQSTGMFLIIERKTTRQQIAHIPETGWPNVEAQLWCYSWIDEFADASEVILVNQLWVRDGYNTLCLSKRTPIWLRSNSEHESRCSEWFEKYGGRIVPQSPCGPLQLPD